VGTTLAGAINTAKSASSVNLTMDAASRWSVTGTSYLSTLKDADTTYSNITCASSGCKVYVNGSDLGIK
jgi:hypothetical protein